jgi:hypothetical protein
MTAPGSTTTNIADGDAHVGVQAGIVHGDLTYNVSSGDSPETKFKFGVAYLDGGMPGRARDLINEAVMSGYRTPESCFYWLLAFLSGRTLQQLSMQELDTLKLGWGDLSGDDGDPWAAGTRTIGKLLDFLLTPDADHRFVERDLDELGAVQRDYILQHLELFLAGTLQDRVWERAFKQAADERFAGERLDRVWRFFHPMPTPPRVRAPRSHWVTIGEKIRIGAAAALFLAATGYVASALLRAGRLSVIPVLLLTIGGAYSCARGGLEGRFRVERRRPKDNEFASRARRGPRPPAGGFADKVEQLFNHYFATYVPPGVERKRWLTWTDGIRRTLRDEMVELYRENRVEANSIAWLIRYLVSDVKRGWQANTLLSYRRQLRTPAVVRAMAVVGGLVAATGLLWMIVSAAQVQPWSVPATVLIGGVGGWFAVLSWSQVILDERRFQAENAEARQRLTDRFAALDRWRRKLARKPTDTEMADWLDCDKKCLINEAMRHYKLQPSNVIAHTFLEAPATEKKRARIMSGPWRYSRYSLLVFLLTGDGVRQMRADLDFEKSTFHGRQRTNYRYDAVAAVHVSDEDDGRTTFELTLVNGHPVEVPVTESRPIPVGPEEDSRTVANASLDAAGLENTLHVLEGVAAEGKQWITYERQREEGRLATLGSAVHRLVE